jgi:hypothetical protein
MALPVLRSNPQGLRFAVRLRLWVTTGWLQLAVAEPDEALPLLRNTIAVHLIVPFASNPEALASRERASAPVLRLTFTVLAGLAALGLLAMKLPRVVWHEISVVMAVLPTEQLAQATFADKASPARIDPKVAILLILMVFFLS